MKVVTIYLITVSVLGFGTALAQPAQFPQPPPLFLGLLLVTCHFLLFLDYGSSSAGFIAATCRSARLRHGGALETRANRRVGTAAFGSPGICQCVFENGSLPLLSHAPIIDVPDFRACNE